MKIYKGNNNLGEIIDCPQNNQQICVPDFIKFDKCVEGIPQHLWLQKINVEIVSQIYVPKILCFFQFEIQLISGYYCLCGFYTPGKEKCINSVSYYQYPRRDEKSMGIRELWFQEIITLYLWLCLHLLLDTPGFRKSYLPNNLVKNSTNMTQILAGKVIFL